VLAIARALYRVGGTAPSSVVYRVLNAVEVLHPRSQPPPDGPGPEDPRDAAWGHYAGTLGGKDSARRRSLAREAGDVGQPCPLATSPGPPAYKAFLFLNNSEGSGWWSSHVANTLLGEEALLPTPTLLPGPAPPGGEPLSSTALVLAFRRAQPLRLVVGFHSHPVSGVLAMAAMALGLAFAMAPPATSGLQALLPIGVATSPAGLPLVKLSMVLLLLAPLWYDIVVGLCWRVRPVDAVLLLPSPLLLWWAWFAWCHAADRDPLAAKWQREVWFVTKCVLWFLLFLRIVGSRPVVRTRPAPARVRNCGRLGAACGVAGRCLGVLLKPVAVLLKGVARLVEWFFAGLEWRVGKREYFTLGGLSLTHQVGS
jgi:hypothetical protein